jgi:hypothetical protein
VGTTWYRLGIAPVIKQWLIIRRISRQRKMEENKPNPEPLKLALRVLVAIATGLLVELLKRNIW